MHNICVLFRYDKVSTKNCRCCSLWIPTIERSRPDWRNKMVRKNNNGKTEIAFRNGPFRQKGKRKSRTDCIWRTWKTFFPSETDADRRMAESPSYIGWLRTHVDSSGIKGEFILTGSTSQTKAIESMRTHSDTGRIGRLKMTIFKYRILHIWAQKKRTQFFRNSVRTIWLLWLDCIFHNSF